ncbi:hypothetical protein ACV566_11945 [Staphylococcus aureus]
MRYLTSGYIIHLNGAAALSSILVIYKLESFKDINNVQGHKATMPVADAWQLTKIQ